MTKDEFRLLAISKVIDQLGGIDLHERACELNDGNEPKDSHYLSAVREALDVIVREEFGEVQPSDVHGGWIPVEKALPDNSDPVLVFQGNASHMRRVAYYDTIGATGWQWCGFHEGDRCDPDAWMKIPPYNSSSQPKP